MVRNTFKSKHRFRVLQSWPSWAPLPTLDTKENLVVAAHLQTNLVGAEQEDYWLRPAQATHVCSVSKKINHKIQRHSRPTGVRRKQGDWLLLAHLEWSLGMLPPPSQDSGGTHPLTPG